MKWGTVSLPEFRAAVAAAMASIKAGDPEGFTELFGLATDPVRRLIANELSAAGVVVQHDQLDELTRTAVVDIAGLAGSWRPDGGALPWTWARQRIIAGAFNSLGDFHSSLDELDTDVDGRLHEASGSSTVATPPTDESDLVEALTRLAGCVPEAELLQSGLLKVARERDISIWLNYVTEQAIGNPAPAGAVARAYDLSEANVRKIVQRVRDALRRLALADPSFGAVGHFPAVAA